MQSIGRRAFLKFGAIAVAAPAPLTACSSGFQRELRFNTFQQAWKEFERLAAARELRSHGPDGKSGWTLAQIASHCAQSIEMSIGGFPELRHALFRATAGRVAFAVFSARGSMSHDVTEPIPGAPAIAADVPLGAATKRLHAVIAVFEEDRGPLRPHFAYGALSRPAYTAAHVMHLANHFSRIEVVRS